MAKMLLGLLDTKIENIQTSIKWGAKIQGTPADQRTAAGLLNITYVRVGAVQIKNYQTSDGNFIDDWSDFKIILTVNWETANPATFPKGADLTTWTNKLGDFLDDWGSKIEVLVIENEPTNRGFYDYDNCDINDYLAQLEAAVTVANNHGVKVTDGCTHIPLLKSVKEDNVNTPNEEDVQTIVNAIGDIPLTYINVHDQFENDTITEDELLEVTSWYSNLVDHPIMSNEWHIENSANSFVTDVVNEWKKTALQYCLIWDVEESHGVGGNITHGDGTLSAMGTNYKNAIT